MELTREMIASTTANRNLPAWRLCAGISAGLVALATWLTPEGGAAAGAPPPGLLIHGIWSDSSVWTTAAPQIRSAGYTVTAIDFRRTAGSSAAPIAAQGAAVGRQVASLLRENRDGQVDLVAHSMGGLAARWYLSHP